MRIQFLKEQFLKLGIFLSESNASLHGLLKEIQASITLLGTRVQNLEARIAHQDVQHDQLLQAINKGDSNIYTKIDYDAASFPIHELP